MLLIVNRYSDVFNGTTGKPPLKDCARGTYKAYAVTHISHNELQWRETGTNHRIVEGGEYKAKDLATDGWVLNIENVDDLMEMLQDKEQFLIHKDPNGNTFLQIIDEHNYVTRKVK